MVLDLELDMPSGVGPTSLRVCNWFCYGSIGSSGCGNPSHECGAEDILSFENLVNCFNRYTLAYDREMSHFIAIAASCFRRWAVSPSKGMSAPAIATVLGTRLERLSLKVLRVPLLCILVSDKV